VSSFPVHFETPTGGLHIRSMDQLRQAVRKHTRLSTGFVQEADADVLVQILSRALSRLPPSGVAPEPTGRPRTDLSGAAPEPK